MNRWEQRAWASFEQSMRDLRPEFDGCIPVAMICLPTTSIQEGYAIESGSICARVMWISGFPVEEWGGAILRLVADGWANRAKDD